MENKKINILFLGGAKRVSIAEKFIDEGKKKSLDVFIFSYELNADVPIAFVGEIILGLRWSSDNLNSHLLEVIDTYNIHIVIPFLDYATIVSARLKDMVKNRGVFIPVSKETVCETFFNKAIANKWCLENDINVPNDLSSYPLIAKPVNGSASKGIILIESESDLQQLNNKDNYLIQKFISGREYSIDIYVSTKTKKIISIVPRERLETQGGESIKSKTIKDGCYIQFARNIIEKSELVGPVTLQFIEDKETKVLYFIEINPRFGGAVVNSIFAGANSPAFLLNDFLGIDNTYTEEWTDHFLMVRRFSEYYKICS